MTFALFIIHASVTELLALSALGLVILYVAYCLFIIWKNSPKRWWNRRRS